MLLKKTFYDTLLFTKHISVSFSSVILSRLYYKNLRENPKRGQMVLYYKFNH